MRKINFEEAKRLRVEGKTFREIADLYGVTKQAVSQAVKYKGSGKVGRPRSETPTNNDKLDQLRKFPFMQIVLTPSLYAASTHRYHYGLKKCILIWRLREIGLDRKTIARVLDISPVKVARIIKGG